ncbi:apolipoprotein L3-like [Protopterus annectens]|uniref:apolipoprotein L3-like n=1 Tax=Protopterus annectens TaxID=7888 RepID=UPI001CFA51B6|nr:apolipoprotein L3-like [Protopterus annectens]XP_043919774.1 apolipoprotein L3-like [Protopterus annectens]XP_043919775.1 apolipoprotein L3-like [Protopterus annectens]
MNRTLRPYKRCYEDEPTDNLYTLCKLRRTVVPQRNQGYLQHQFHSAAKEIVRKTYELDRIADAIDKLHLTNKKVAIGGNVASVTGCAVGLAGLGLSLAPFTAGISTAVFFVGGAACAVGKITNGISLAHKTMKTESYVKSVTDILKEIKNTNKNLQDIINEFQTAHGIDIMSCITAFSNTAVKLGLRGKAFSNVFSLLEKSVEDITKDALKSEDMAKSTKPVNTFSLTSVSNQDKLIIGAAILFEMAFDLGQIMKDCNDVCEGCSTEQAKHIHDIAKKIRDQVLASQTAVRAIDVY